jgi:hypothetical protein
MALTPQEEEQVFTSDSKPLRNEKGQLLPGQTANPYGRPIGSVSIVTELRKRLQEIPTGEKRAYIDLFVDRIMEKAMVEGDVAIMRDLIDRIDGKPAQSVDMTTNGKDLPTPILGGVAHQTDAEN